MTREWQPEPGCIAAITLGNGHHHPVAIWRLHDGWQTPQNTVHPAHVASVRPLVVIDPEDREAVGRLVSIAMDVPQPFSMRIDDMQAALREFANPTPPKPDEPTGLGAVVEDGEGVRWTRTLSSGGRRPWGSDSGTFQRFLAYVDLDAVRVLSEGVTP